MLTRVRNLVVATATSGALVFGLAPTAAAQPVNQDGLVNVNVGDVTVIEFRDVNVAAVIGIAATLCDIDVGPVAVGVLGRAIAVDRSGRSRTICTTSAGDDVTIMQNT
jgi:hypothetical protein